MNRRLRCFIPIALLAITFTGSCSKDTTSTEQSDTGPRDYSARGSYAVGVVTGKLTSGVSYNIFYPAKEAGTTEYQYSASDLLPAGIAGLLPGAFKNPVTVSGSYPNLEPIDHEPFPVVLFSHGFGSSFLFSSKHHAHVASWGYVVIAVDHPQRGLASQLGGATTSGDDVAQLKEALQQAPEATTPSGTKLGPIMNMNLVAAEGHSAGGRATGLLASSDASIDAWIGLAPASPTEKDAANPSLPHGASLIVAADNDVAIPLTGLTTLFGQLATPKRMVTLDNSGHNIFTDICQPIQQDGGLSAAIKALGIDPGSLRIVKLGEDGCLAANPPADKSLNVANHVVVAFLESILKGAKGAEDALGQPWLNTTFPNLVESST